MRRMYYANALKNDPYNVELKSDLGWMDYALEQLEELLGYQSFWYGETLICALAKRSKHEHCDPLGSFLLGGK